ncbi:hypothetical protein [Salipiger sp.]|uniref:hypothetical protein n=1 Tax=Salipiger sp. TaxID=2078585 RepID=UPI003A97EEF9
MVKISATGLVAAKAKPGDTVRCLGSSGFEKDSGKNARFVKGETYTVVSGPDGKSPRVRSRMVPTGDDQGAGPSNHLFVGAGYLWEVVQ